MSKIRVVLVDDEESVIDLMKEQLSFDDRVEVVGTGHNGREALRLANSLRPDVMVLDIQMPILNGLEACARITSAFPATAVVIATGNRGEEFLRAAMQAGAKDFLDKPISATQLAEGIVKANDKRDVNAPSRGFASVWAYYSAKASAGGTMLAANTAVDLASLGYNVLIVDLDTTTGDCARYLGHTFTDDGPDVFTRLAQIKEAKKETVEPLISKVVLPVTPRLSIDALLTPGQFVAPAPRAGDVLRDLFDLLITMYDYIVVDVPPGRLFDRHVGAVLDFAERFFMVANTEMSAMHAVRSVASTLESTGWSFDRLSLVLSGLVAQSQFNARQWLIDHKIPLHELLTMPVDARACAWSLQRGVPVLFSDPRSEYAAFVHSVVDHALNRPPVTGAATTLWGKLKGLLKH